VFRKKKRPRRQFQDKKQPKKGKEEEKEKKKERGAKWARGGLGLVLARSTYTRVKRALEGGGRA